MQMNKPLEKLLYSLREVGRQIGRHERTVYRMVDGREIKAIRVRNRWMITHEDLMHYISSRQTN